MKFLAAVIGVYVAGSIVLLGAAVVLSLAVKWVAGRGTASSNLTKTVLIFANGKEISQNR